MKSTEELFNEQLNSLLENLLNDLSSTDVVYIVPHKRMDFDAIASASALAELMVQLGKTCYIVTDDDEFLMEENIKEMYVNLKKRYNFINSDKMKKIYTTNGNELVIVVDANKKYLVPIQADLDSINKIAIIDHHNPDEHTINSNYNLINTEISSTSEIVFALLNKFYVEIEPYLAHCLFAGIYLDTAALTRNFKCATAKTITELMELGANSEDVIDLFSISDFEGERQKQREINKLIDNSIFEVCGLSKVAITMDFSSPYTLYPHEVLSKCADDLLRYGVTAAFVIGYTDLSILGEGHRDIVSIKARSKKYFDVSEIMSQFKVGGGSTTSGACEINTTNINEIPNSLLEMIRFSHIVDSDESNKILTLTQ